MPLFSDFLLIAGLYFTDPADCVFRWAILFSHPRDFTPVCTTELGNLVSREPEFTKRGVKLIALSCDSVEDHKAWSKVCFFMPPPPLGTGGVIFLGCPSVCPSVYVCMHACVSV